MITPLPQFRRFQFHEYDPEQFRQVVDGGDMEHTILAPGVCSAEVKQLHAGRVSVDVGFYEFPFVARGIFPPDRICIGLAWGLRESAWANGVEVDQATLVVHAEGNELFYRAGGHSGWIVVAIGREELQAAAEEQIGRQLALPRRGSLPIRVSAPYVHRLVDLIHGTSRRMEGGEGGRTPVADHALVTACVEAIASGDPVMEELVRRRVVERNRMVRRADAAMRQLVGDSYSSEGLCRALGVTERTLQLYFKESIGLTPKSWFQRLALNRAHQELLHRSIGKNVVTDVALDCGFSHFGRFARAYRELFGRAPSETVQARRAGRLLREKN